MKFTIDIQHRYTDNDNEENEYKVSLWEVDTSPGLDVAENTFECMYYATNWIRNQITDKIITKGLF